MDQKQQDSIFVSHHHPAPDFRWAFRILKVHRLWIFSAIIFSISLALLVHIFEKSRFLSVAVISMNVRTHVTPFESLGLGNPDSFLPKVYSLMEQFKNPDTCEALAESIQAKIGKKASISAAEVRTACGSLSFDPDMDRMQIRVSSRTNDPLVSQLAANAAAMIFIDRDRKRVSHRVSELKRFLASQEKELGRQLKQIETEKTLFQASSSLISVAQAEKSITERLETAEKDYLDLQVQIKSNENLIAQTKNSLAALKNALVGSGNPNNISSMYLNQIQYRLNMLQYRKSMLKSGKDQDELQRIDSEISQIMKVYNQALDGKDDPALAIGGDPIEYLKSLKASYKTLIKDREQLKMRSGAIEESIKKKAYELKELAASMQRLGELSRENDITSGLYQVIKKRLQEIEIEEAGSISDFSILTLASPGYRENVPLSKKMLFYLAVGLFCVVGILFIRDSMVPSIKNLHDIEKLGLNALGYIPIVPVTPLADLPLLLKDYPDSLEADSFRALRLRMQALKTAFGNDSSALVVLVTSPRPATGKTFVSSNLAYTLAKNGLKTLIVDLDLRKPSVAKYFADSNLKGQLEKYPQHNNPDALIETVMPELDVICPNTVIPNSADFIETIHAPKMIAHFRTQYDFIIIDMPPALAVIDPLLVATVADLHLVIVEHRKTHREDIINTIEVLSEIKKSPILGLMNLAHPDIIYADSGRYYKIITPKRKAS